MTTTKWVVDYSKLQDYIANVKHRAENEGERELMRLVGPMIKEAKKIAPKGPTKNLSQGIHGAFITGEGFGGRQSAVLGVLIGTPVYYAYFQEMGFTHWKTGAWIRNQFLAPAVEKGFSAFVDGVKGMVNKWIVYF